MNKPKILACAMQRAERFGPLAAGTLLPYDEEKQQPALYSRWLDPLFLWSLNRCRNPHTLCCCITGETGGQEAEPSAR
jgi:hypothetical protein